MLIKIIFKAYEYLLRVLRPVNLEFFCQTFPARPYASESIFPQSAEIHVFIPFRNRWELTEKCLRSLLCQTRQGIALRIHLIDNNSDDDTVRKVKAWLSQNLDLVETAYCRQDEPFNFSQLCNRALSVTPLPGVQQFFLFLNNDVALENTETLATCCRFMLDNPDSGATGITLLFPDRTIQHLFAAPGVKIIAAHPFKGRSLSILHDWNKLARQVPALTGAFLMVRGDLFREIGGFDENLPTAGQDIDLCLQMQKRGYGTWVLPQLQAIHYESASRRGKPINIDEVAYIYDKWKTDLAQNPAYPLQISRWSEQPVFRLFEHNYPYRLVMGRSL